MASLLELVQTTMTPEITKQVSALVGETPAATESAIRRAVPAVLAGVVNNASTPARAERLAALINEGGWGSDVLAELATRLGGGSGTSALVSAGTRLISVFFGSKADVLGEVIARGGGVHRRSASTILGVVAPVVMSVIGTQISARRLDASALSTLLSSERTALVGALPAGISGLLGMSSAASPAVTAVTAARTGFEPASERAPERPEPLERVGGTEAVSRFKRWWPALAAGVAMLAVLVVVTRGRQRDVVSEVPAASPRQMTSIALPDGARVNVMQGGPVQQLSSYLADRSTTDSGPKRFVFNDLNFELGATTLSADAQPTVDSLLAVLNAYPAVQISLEGHTDNTGDAAANKRLSEERAETVKQTLVNGGIQPERVNADGFGQERPIADNNTEAGRARNRRLELVVLKR